MPKPCSLDLRMRLLEAVIAGASRREAAERLWLQRWEETGSIAAKPTGGSISRVPHGHWKTVTFVAGLRYNKMAAPFVVDGPMTRSTFLVYLAQCLRPTLRRGDIVIMDNLPAHKGIAVKKTIEAAHAKLLYLPKYSPDLNPIEQAFSKFKALLRKASERTIAGLCRRIGKLIAGYASKTTRMSALWQLSRKKSGRQREALRQCHLDEWQQTTALNLPSGQAAYK